MYASRSIDDHEPYHMNNGFQQMWAEIKNLFNHAYVPLYVQHVTVKFSPQCSY